MGKILFPITFICLLSLSVNAQEGAYINTSKSPHSKLKSLDMGSVKWTEGFWAEKFDLVRNTTIPFMKTIYMDRAFLNFKIAAGMEEGEFWGKWWHDGDFYKWLEAQCYIYAQTGDKEIKKQIDEIITVIGKAQAEDGYISTANQIGKGKTVGPYTGESSFSEKKRWQSAGDHELYNMGHLITAACIHYRATRKKNFLNIAMKAADHLYDVFSKPSPELSLLVFNPSQIMALVELYRIAREPKYLELAKSFIDMYGSSPKGSDQNQNRVPFREANEAVGHAVLAAYLYCGAADVYAETGEKELYDALVRLWQNVVHKKMYITGGIGAIHNGTSSAGDNIHEAFGREYELPNATAYNETCANIGNGMWNWRMLNITGDARYADIMEKVFYNSGISGMGIYGISFFYTNVLEWHGQQHELLSNDALQRWNLPRVGICCPPSVARTIIEMSSYAYSISEDAVWVHLYGANTLDTRLPDGSKVRLSQETDYPWKGEIKITVNQTPEKDIAIMLRIPGWAKGSELFVNGKDYAQKLEPGSYINITRRWSEGDIIKLNLPMKAQLISGNPAVNNLLGKIAIQRGPIVYCLESYDLPAGIKISDVLIPSDISLKPRYNESSLAGVTVLEGEVLVEKNVRRNPEKLHSNIIPQGKEKVKTIFIPYYTWNNRFDTKITGGSPAMSVWLPVLNH